MIEAHEPAFPYDRADYEEVPCNLCGRTDAETVCPRDRNGLRVRSVLCRHCGLIYLSPRMTPAWYSRYYEVEYRRQMAAYKGRVETQTFDSIFASQLRRGEWLVEYLREHQVSPPRSALEIGCSTGGLLRALADAFGTRVLGVEPSPEEAEFARRHGVAAHVGLFEDYEPRSEQRFDLVICSQSFNHLLNPRKVAEHVRRCLTPQGAFFLECQDFFHVCRLRGVIHQAVQIDHVYMFVPQTLQAMVEVAGLELLPGSLTVDRWQSPESLRKHQAQGLPSLHARLLARPGTPTPTPRSSYLEIRTELDALPNSLFGAMLKKGWKRAKQRLRPLVRRVFHARKAAG